MAARNSDSALRRHLLRNMKRPERRRLVFDAVLILAVLKR